MSINNSDFDIKKTAFIELTHHLNNYNEIYNTNAYLKEMNDTERDRLDATSKNLRSKVLRAKQEYLLNEHAINEYKLRSNIMYGTVILISIYMIMFGLFYLDKIKNMILISVVGVSSIIYLIFVIFILMANAKRRNYAWNQYYWLDMKQVQ